MSKPDNSRVIRLAEAQGSIPGPARANMPLSSSVVALWI